MTTIKHRTLNWCSSISLVSRASHGLLMFLFYFAMSQFYISAEILEWVQAIKILKLFSVNFLPLLYNKFVESRVPRLTRNPALTHSLPCNKLDLMDLRMSHLFVMLFVCFPLLALARRWDNNMDHCVRILLTWLCKFSAERLIVILIILLHMSCIVMIINLWVFACVCVTQL